MIPPEIPQKGSKKNIAPHEKLPQEANRATTHFHSMPSAKLKFYLSTETEHHCFGKIPHYKAR